MQAWLSFGTRSSRTKSFWLPSRRISASVCCFLCHWVRERGASTTSGSLLHALCEDILQAGDCELPETARWLWDDATRNSLQACGLVQGSDETRPRIPPQHRSAFPLSAGAACARHRRLLVDFVSRQTHLFLLSPLHSLHRTAALSTLSVQLKSRLRCCRRERTSVVLNSSSVSSSYL